MRECGADGMKEEGTGEFLKKKKMGALLGWLDATGPDAAGRRGGLGAVWRVMACQVRRGCPSTVCKNKTITLHLATPRGTGPRG